MASLSSEVRLTQAQEFIDRFGRAGMSVERFKSLLRSGNEFVFEEMVAAIERIPFALTVGQQLKRLREANDAQGWKLDEGVFTRLTETAPDWPLGRDVFRSLRIRFGVGHSGVALTFETHAAEIERVFGEDQFRRGETVLSFTHTYSKDDPARLRLLVGNDSHKPVIEWVIVDLSAHRDVDKVVRGPSSIADEGLVFTWMFPERIWATNRTALPAFLMAGYEINIPERKGVEMQDIPGVSFNRKKRQVSLDSYWHGEVYSGFSVPVLRE